MHFGKRFDNLRTKSVPFITDHRPAKGAGWDALAVEYPARQYIALDCAADSLSGTEIVDDLGLPQAGAGFFEACNNRLYVGFAWRADGRIVAGKGQYRMPVLRTRLDDAVVEPDTINVPLILTGEVLVGRNDDVAGNAPAVFLTDNVVKLAVRNKVHSSVSVDVGFCAFDKGYGAVPRIREIGEIQRVPQGDLSVGAWSRFVLASWVILVRPLGSASLDIAIKTLAEEIGAVSGIPDEVVIRCGDRAAAHGRAF